MATTAADAPSELPRDGPINDVEAPSVAKVDEVHADDEDDLEDIFDDDRTESDIWWQRFMPEVWSPAL